MINPKDGIRAFRAYGWPKLTYTLNQLTYDKTEQGEGDYDVPRRCTPYDIVFMEYVPGLPVVALTRAASRR
jgi:hypothetical protein